MAITDYIPGSFDDAIAEALSSVGQAANEAAGDTLQKKGPLRGAYLEYEIDIGTGDGVGIPDDVSQDGGSGKMRLLMKEPIANWFGLTPKYPQYGTFNGGGNNTGKKYTKRAGFRFASFQVLLKPETEMLVPIAKASVQRSMGGDARRETQRIASFFIGVSSKVTVSEFIDFLKGSDKSDSIIGIITPRKRKHQWGGVFSHAEDE